MKILHNRHGAGISISASAATPVQLPVKTSGPAVKAWNTRGSTTWKPSRVRASRLTGKTRKNTKAAGSVKSMANCKPRMGNRAMLLGKIFANPHLPGIDDYYEPFDFDYQNLHTAPEGSKSQPIARPRSLITGERMAKIEKGPNWEDDLGGEF